MSSVASVKGNVRQIIAGHSVQQLVPIQKIISVRGKGRREGREGREAPTRGTGTDRRVMRADNNAIRAGAAGRAIRKAGLK